MQPGRAEVAAGRVDESGTTARRKKAKLSPKRQASLKLQGRYMDTLRGPSARQQARVKRIRKEKGVRAAVVEARRLAR